MKFRRLVSLCLLFFIILCVSCSNSSNSGNDSGAEPEWSSVSNKSDLIGTWKADFYNSGIHDINTIYLGSNFSGFLKAEGDYSQAAANVKNSIPAVIAYYRSRGFTCTHDISLEKYSVIMNFTSEDLDNLISQGNIKIHSSKNKIQFTDDGKTAEYVKQ